MEEGDKVPGAAGTAGALRVVWAGTSLVLVESVLFGVSVLPAALGWLWLFQLDLTPHWLDLFILATTFLPAYALFAIVLVVLSALVTRLLRWRTPPDAELPLAGLGWPLLAWARYNVSIYVCGSLAGPILRNTPLWNMYMRLNGARLGRRVWINSLKLSDHNLLDFGDDVVIGADAHVSGHMVERGHVITAPVKLGDGVVVGLGAHVAVGVTAGPRCQIGSLSMVPKYTRLEAGATYAGTPVQMLSGDEGERL